MTVHLCYNSCYIELGGFPIVVLIDLTGQRFGKLTVTGSYHKKNPAGTDEIFWRCVCDCNGTVPGYSGRRDVRGFSLRSGDTTSCGCVRQASVEKPRKPDLVGMQFSRLTVLERVRVRDSKGRCATHFICKCSCKDGNVVKVAGSSLRDGSTRSCGCIRREMLPVTKYLPNVYFVLKEYKKSAKTRKLEWYIADEYATRLVEDVCYY